MTARIGAGNRAAELAAIYSRRSEPERRAGTRARGVWS